VSSSGHVALVPWLLGWPCAGMAPEARKSLEVALHAGSTPALALAVRREGLGPHAPLALTLLPPALAGLLFERPVEERLGGPRSVAVAQLAAGTALLLADRTPERRSTPGALDHLAVGVAQAVALAPGVSRSGAAFTAARLRRLSRQASQRLALRAAMPVTLAAAALKGFRAAARFTVGASDSKRFRAAQPATAAAAKPLAVAAAEPYGARAAASGFPPGLARSAAAGAAAALLSGLASLPLLPSLERRGFVRVLAGYRIALGGASLALERWRIRPFRPIVDPRAGDTSYLRSPPWPPPRRSPLPTRGRRFGTEPSPDS
jgi:undecaprenyl-diphosphatase